jgi:DNA-binding NarL/FixJ family response regulator
LKAKTYVVNSLHSTHSQQAGAFAMSTTKEITIFIAEDHLIARMGLKMLLEQSSQFNVIGEAEDGQAAVDEVLKLKPEVIMMDLGLPKLNGIEATEQIKRALPNSKILIFTTAEDDESIFAALKAGADGYCLKTISGELLSTAIHSVLSGAAWLDPGIANKVLRAQSTQSSGGSDGSKPLTQSKLQLLGLVEQGKTFEEIASELRVNDTLVKGLLNELLSQLKGDLDAPTSISKAAPKEMVIIRPGDVIGGHYKIEQRIGHGGMGSVFKASHTFIDRQVAVKTLHEHLASEKNFLGRFKAEAQASSAIVHPNLATVYDFGLLEDRVPYIVMEYLDGFDLSDLLQEVGKVDIKTATMIFRQVCEVLATVHAKGIVHRDLKPSNIMLVSKDENPFFVKVVDFGIAKVLDDEKEALTLTGEALGSPPYMSPEQCCARPIDHRSDLYSLGCVMYETYTGSRVFETSSAIETMMKHVNDTPSESKLVEARVPGHIIQIIKDLLKKDPQKRPSSAAEVHKVLMR